MINEELAILLNKGKGEPFIKRWKAPILYSTLLSTAIAIYAYCQPCLIRVVALHHKQDMIGQELRINSNKPITASWNAEINRDNIVVCTGHGTGIYEPRKPGDVRWLPVDIWAGTKCPAIKSGDIAIASWTYKNWLGLEKTVFGEVEITQH